MQKPQLLITVLDQPKRESVLRLKGHSRQTYKFRWARVGKRGFYAFEPEDQRAIDDLFRKGAHTRRLGVYSSVSQAPEVPSYNKATKDDLFESCKNLGLHTDEKDTARVLRRVLDAYWQGACHG